MEMDIEVPRYRGESAQLAALAAQVRLAPHAEDKAVAAGRLARQLMRRGIELRDALALSEKALSIVVDPELALDVARWWAEAGDPIRGAALANSMLAELPAERHADALMEVARVYARSGQVHQAAQALRRVMELQPDSPEAFELFGSLGFWAELPKAECSRALLRAAELRKLQKEDAPSFENRLRAFEVDPSFTDAAIELANALRRRGRSGAADEILREHLRNGSEAQKAAHHQRSFYSSLSSGDLEGAFESALEAELDVDVDVSRVFALVVEDAPARQDFESFLYRIATSGELGAGSPFALWLLTLVEMYRTSENGAEVKSIRRSLIDKCNITPLPELERTASENLTRLLRARLAVEHDEAEASAMRIEIARRECERGAYHDAMSVIEPVLSGENISLPVAVLGAALAGRAGKSVARARALSWIASYLHGACGAIANAVAAERLLGAGMNEEAHRTADAAVEAEPKNERAIATQSLVALRAPDGASASLLEHSLSILVARSDACALLCEAANLRGSERLALTWAARALSLRPGDVGCGRRYLQQALATHDAEKVSESLSEVLLQSAPVLELAPSVIECLKRLSETAPQYLESVGKLALRTYGMHQTELLALLTQVAELHHLHELLALITEMQLVSSDASNRAPLFEKLCRYRLAAGQAVPAARALKRLQLAGASAEKVATLLPQFATELEPDARLAILELRAEYESLPEETESQAERLLQAGAARWDMAQDTAGAIQLWLRAAELEPQQGLDTFAHYLRRFAGAEGACVHLKQAAKNTENPTRSGRLLGFAAREMMMLGRRAEAFGLAQTALERAPLLTDTLAIAETCADDNQVGTLDRIYSWVADAALGNYGERALHYRAARQLEKRGALELALPHACAAFEAAPAEGVAFVLMARLADATLGHAQLISSLERVADASPNDAERSRWLSRAARMSDTEGVGRKERVDLLWRAAQMLPERETLDSLFDALAHCLVDEPDSRDELWERYLKLCRDILTHASGAHGAELHIAFASVAVTHFDHAEHALALLKQAVNLDAELPDYERIQPLANQLAGAPGAAGALIDEVRAQADAGVLLGPGLARLIARLAQLLGDEEIAAELLVRTAVDFPEDTTLAAQARGVAARLGRSDLSSQIEGLLPTEERAKSVLERLPQFSDDEAVAALSEIELDGLPGALKIRILSELGPRQEQLSQFDDAALTFRELSEIDPKSDAALLGLERDAERRGRHEELAQILGRRVELSSDAGEVRRLTLRRATVMETRLGRAPEARQLLAELVRQKEDRAALRLLADSWERSGDSNEAAELWVRVQAVAADQDEADDAAYRAAACFFQAGMGRRAAELLAQIAKPNHVHRQLALEVARDGGDEETIIDALVLLAESTISDRNASGELYLEAAQRALGRGLLDKAEGWAERACVLLPHASAAQLLGAQLRFRHLGALSDADIHHLAEQLQATLDLTTPPEQEMSAFLRAKLAIKLGETASASAILASCPLAAEGYPLLALVQAELLEQSEPERALALMDTALGKDLRGMYQQGEVLLRAGAIAQRLEDFDRARSLISMVSDDDPLRVRAAKELEEVALAQARKKRLEREQRQAEEQAELAAREEAERRKVAEEQAALVASERAAEAARAEAAREEAARAEAARAEAARAEAARAEAARAEAARAEAARAEETRQKAAAEREKKAALDAIREAARREHQAATRAVSEHEQLAPPARAAAGEPSGAPRRASAPPDLLEGALIESFKPPPVPNLDDLAAAGFELDSPSLPPVEAAAAMREAEVAVAKPQVAEGEQSHQPARAERASARRAAPQRTEDELVALLEQGDIPAGTELLDRLSADRVRARDAVLVAGHLALLNPADASMMGRLVSTASRDGNESLALAVRHVLGAYGSGDPVDAPPLSQLADQGGAGFSLVRQVNAPANEALALVWENAGGLYKKELSHYGISGIERVPLQAPTPLGQLYNGAARILAQLRTPLFRSSAVDEISLHVALLQPPAVIVAGRVEETSSELAFHFGAMLAACAPEHALLFSSEAHDIEVLLDALSLSFGSGRTSNGERPSQDVTRVASYFWESIPPRAQRRLTQLCNEPGQLTYGNLATASRFALRRAGLIVCGDLPTAIDDACAEAGLAPPRNLAELAVCSKQSAAVFDLLNLALSPEYAHVRFEKAR